MNNDQFKYGYHTPKEHHESVSEKEFYSHVSKKSEADNRQKIEAMALVIEDELWNS